LTILKRKKKLLFFVTEDWYFCSHRLPLAISAQEAGYDVSVVTRVNQHGDEIKRAGINLIPIELSRRGINIVKEFKTIARVAKIYKKERPDYVHHIALKPVIYGTIASMITGVPRVVNAMAGMGLLFSSKSYKFRVLKPFIKLMFRFLLNRKKSRVILQNPDDVKLLTQAKILNKDSVELILGSGVDPQKYFYIKEQADPPVVVLASRLLWDKGIKEFVDAARILKSEGVIARFVLVGEGDSENPSAIPHSKLKEWHEQGDVEWWGRRNNMPEVFAQSSVVCLPSFYGEGVPKVLIEAASCGRAIVTTDTPGCREIVKDGVNGLLVPPGDVAAVADAIKQLIDSPELRSKMAAKGRELVEREFSLKKVNTETLQVYKDLLN
jgi:glycosyltransferase involved in cell wall biosynthesis